MSSQITDRRLPSAIPERSRGVFSRWCWPPRWQALSRSTPADSCRSIGFARCRPIRPGCARRGPAGSSRPSLGIRMAVTALSRPGANLAGGVVRFHCGPALAMPALRPAAQGLATAFWRAPGRGGPQHRKPRGRPPPCPAPGAGAPRLRYRPADGVGRPAVVDVSWVSPLGMRPRARAYVNAGTHLAPVSLLQCIGCPGLPGSLLLPGLLPLAPRAALS